jgi:hypothetical protein
VLVVADTVDILSIAEKELADTVDILGIAEKELADTVDIHEEFLERR